MIIEQVQEIALDSKSICVDMNAKPLSSKVVFEASPMKESWQRVMRCCGADKAAIRYSDSYYLDSKDLPIEEAAVTIELELINRFLHKFWCVKVQVRDSENILFVRDNEFEKVATYQFELVNDDGKNALYHFSIIPLAKDWTIPSGHRYRPKAVYASEIKLLLCDLEIYEKWYKEFVTDMGGAIYR